MSPVGSSEIAKLTAEVASAKAWIIAHAGITLAVAVGIVVLVVLKVL